MRTPNLFLLLALPVALIPSPLAAQLLTGSQGGILRPSGDASLSSIILGSATAPDGKMRFVKDVYLVQTSSGTVRQLTAFDNAPGTPGVTAVAIASNGQLAAYSSITYPGGQKREEIHTIDLATGSDKVVATDSEGCIQPECVNCFAPCLHDLHFSLDGQKLIWMSSRTNPFFVATLATGTVLRLSIPNATLANSPSVVTADGRLVFLIQPNATPYAIQLDGTGLTQLPYGPIDSEFVISADGKTAAWQYLATVNGQPVYSVQRASSGGAQTVLADAAPFSSLALSTDGARTAFVHQRQAWTPAQATNFGYSDVLDLSLDAAGTRMLYSTAELNSGQRAAVWLADASGANPKAVFAPASINTTGVIGINSQGLPLSLSPGTYFTVYGKNLHYKDELVTGNFPVSITQGGRALPLQAVTPWQMNAFLPMDTPAGTTPFALALEGGGTLAFSATINRTAPALITFPNSTGLQQAAAFHLSTLIPCDAQHPARANEVIETYGFGLGLTDPAQQIGVPAPSNPPARTITTPTVLIGTQPAQIVFSGLVPTVIGVYQINILTPPLPAGDYQMQWNTFDPTPASKGNFSVR